MANSGKWDKFCRFVLDESEAAAAVVIVLEDGVTLAAAEEDYSIAGDTHHIARLPHVLRKLADKIEKP